MEELKKLGIAENTLFFAMADNGPMVHSPPPGWGMLPMIYRGGKGDFTEGGVRVPAFAWWPGMIDEHQMVGDIIHVTDLYTTFARLAGATEYIPTDRVVDGLDQTALFMNGDTHGRRDFVFIYTGHELAATVKGRYKRHWIGAGEAAATGTPEAYYDLGYESEERVVDFLPGGPCTKGNSTRWSLATSCSSRSIPMCPTQKAFRTRDYLTPVPKPERLPIGSGPLLTACPSI